MRSYNKSVPGKGKSICEGQEARGSTVYLKHWKPVGVEHRLMAGRQAADHEGFISHAKKFGL